MPAEQHRCHLHVDREQSARGRHGTKLVRLAAEVAERQIFGAGECRSAIRREPPARLKGYLQQDSERHSLATILAEVPRIGRNFVLRFARGSGLHHERFAGHIGDAIEELERRSGQSSDDPIVIEDRVRFAEPFRRLAIRVRENLGRIVKWPFG